LILEPRLPTDQRQYVWNHEIRQEDFILIPMKGNNFLDPDAVEDILAQLRGRQKGFAVILMNEDGTIDAQLLEEILAQLSRR
jgi:hypothetical protein